MQISSKIIPRSYYARDTVEVAHDLIGALLVREWKGNMLVGMIVETEAYRSDEPSCHAYRGCTARTKALFGDPGHAYIYFTYGNHYCLNIVAHDAKHAGGVLIRALQPLQGIEVMQQTRNISSIHSLTNGPGKLAQALHITKTLYGHDVTKKSELYVCQGPTQEKDVIATKRIGISQAQDLEWRFCLKGSPYLSRKL